MKTNLTIFTFILGMLVSGNGLSQSQVLDAYQEEGIRNNLQLKQEKFHYERSLENLNQARALFMPHVAFQASYTLAGGGRKIEIPVGDLLNPVYTTLNQMTGSDNFPMIANTSEQFLPNRFHDTKVRIIQPLFNPEIYFNYKAQQQLISVQHAQKEVYENDLRYSIASAYYQYMQSEEGLLILADTRALLKELVRVNNSLVENGKATRDVLLNAEFELTQVEQRLTEAMRDNELARSYFNFLLNRPLNQPIIRDTTLLTSLTESHDFDALTRYALTNRPEVKQLQAGLEANQQVVELNRSGSLLPAIVAVGDIGYQGFNYTFANDQDYYLVQFSLSWNLFKGGEKRSRISQAKVDYHITENKLQQLQKQIELQVIESYRNVEAARQSYRTAVTGERQAERAFTIIRSKYLEGQALLLEYLDAQNRLTSARLQKAIATYSVLDKEAALQRTIANL